LAGDLYYIARVAKIAFISGPEKPGIDCLGVAHLLPFWAVRTYDLEPTLKVEE
jgi:hypothetical protein